ncbi:MurR/RpiR family transcriptional regulator [Paenibacillus sp. PR3]|uniref:MurR/RpiR family transcriptional regulator n=1 Tax=Paenibacillus terricola TaxID=2763503 RepID=A0ABR8N276_9BACL|nr:MurR/RpiR family transcriptional regulator [Paenibacillus terricola]
MTGGARVLFGSYKLTRGHRLIADYISKNLDDIPFMVEEDLAAACQVSVSTVSRFWIEVGSKNMKEFKQKLKDEVIMSPSRKLQSAFSKMEEQKGAAAASVMAPTEYLRQSADRLDQTSFQAAADLLAEAGMVHIYGPGSAECLTALLDFRLTRFGVYVKRIARGGHELFEDIVHMHPGDVIALFGFVAESPEMVVLLDAAKQRGCKTLLVTDLAVSPMLEKADIVLYTARGQQWEFHSMVAPIAVMEALIVAVGKQREQQALANSEELHRLRRQYQKWLPKKV